MRLIRYYSIFLNTLLLLLSQSKEFRYLRSLPVSGKYNPGGLHSEYLRSLRMKENIEITDDGFVKADRDQLSAFYFGPNKLVVEECNIDEFGEEKCIVRGVIPVPIRSAFSDEIESSLTLAMKPKREVVFENWKGSVITDRDRGLFDNFDILFKKWSLPNAKKQIFESLKIRKSGQDPSPYHALKSAIETHAGGKITGLILEVADTINEVSLSLGAAVMIAKSDNYEKWQLTVSNCKQLIREERSNHDEVMILDCYIDELLGLHLATKIPVIISNSLFDRLSIDGLLEKLDENDDTKLRLLTPYFDKPRDAENWMNQLEASRAKPAKPVPKVSDIKDASAFLRLRNSEKRAILRSSGIYALPRPREGPRKVDAIMIPLLDEEVAYEVLRRLGESRGDFKVASKMQDFESRKPQIAKLYTKAVKDGDKELAKFYCDELNAIATLRFDPSNPEAETPKGGFDIEEWYWEQRKRVYNIIA